MGKTLEYETPFLRRYQDEIEYITEHLWNMEEYANVRFCALANREEKPNVKASFLSTVITTVERRIVDVAMAKLASPEFGYLVDAYVFDGFMVQKKEGVDVFPQEQLEELAYLVLEETGYGVSFVEKSLKPTVEDLERIRPPFNNTFSNSQWYAETVFSELRSIANVLNTNPKPENLSTFEDAIVPVMNQGFAILRDGQTVHVVARTMSKRLSNDVQYERSKKSDAIAAYKKDVFFISDGENNTKIEPFKLWVDNEYALTYHSMTFNPRPIWMNGSATPFEINTFVGMAYEPTEKLSEAECKELEENELKPFWDHIWKIWCCEDECLFNFVKNWIWSKVTRPWHKVQSALVLQSEQGAGKGVIVEKVAEVIGERYLSSPDSLEDITSSNFTRLYFENCLLLFLDEAFYAGSKSTKSQVKKLITGSLLNVEEKFMPKYTVENFLSIVLASNEKHVVNMEAKTRRYVNLALSNAYAGVHSDKSAKRAYFDAIVATDPQLLCNYLHSIPAPEFSGEGHSKDAGRRATSHQVLLPAGELRLRHRGGPNDNSNCED